MHPLLETGPGLNDRCSRESGVIGTAHLDSLLIGHFGVGPNHHACPAIAARNRACYPDRMASPAPNPSQPETDEQALVDRLRADDEAAYEEVVRRFSPRMLSVARRLLTQEQDAQDAVQDAFLSAFKAL